LLVAVIEFLLIVNFYRFFFNWKCNCTAYKWPN